jgi:DNA polymerase I-like protein with 3'-5' exonuclease and polymerase domains
MNLEYPIKVNYEWTDDYSTAYTWLQQLPKLFAADFEVASKYTKRDKELFKYRLDHRKLSDEEYRVNLQALVSDGLSYPSLTEVTHLSVGWTDRDSKVIVCNSAAMRNLVFKFLTETTSTQIWHNASFDFKHIFYNTGKLPKNYIDTQLLAKCILNDADSFKDRTGLKDLMAYAYGDWAISKENFTLEEMYDENMIRYAATDSPATYRLYQDILKDLNGWKI